MKIAIIGATRGIGLALTQLALESGHEVTVLVRDASKMTIEHPKLRLVPGDVLNQASVETALQGQDAVCTCIGVQPKRGPIDTFSRGAHTVLAAMAKTPLVKLVAVTGIGAGDSRGHGGFVYDKLILPLLLKTIYQDKDREEALIKASAVNWMIVRPGMLSNGPRTGKYRVLNDLKGITAGKMGVSEFLCSRR